MVSRKLIEKEVKIQKGLNGYSVIYELKDFGFGTKEVTEVTTNFKDFLNRIAYLFGEIDIEKKERLKIVKIIYPKLFREE